MKYVLIRWLSLHHEFQSIFEVFFFTLGKDFPIAVFVLFEIYFIT